MFNCGSISQKTHRALRDIKDLKMKNFKHVFFFLLLLFFYCSGCSSMHETNSPESKLACVARHRHQTRLHSLGGATRPAPLRSTTTDRKHARSNKQTHKHFFFFQPTVKSQQRVRLPRTHLQTRGIHKFRSSAPSALSFKVAVSA